jgi:predicted transcriptional regulator
MEISSLSKLLRRLFETKTITPSYKIPHILFCIMIIGKESKGIGRYRIRKEINLGEGSIKTLLNRLKEENIIKVDKNRQKGHIITKTGKKIIQDIEKLISYPQDLVNKENKFVVGKIAYYSIVDQQYIKRNLGSSIDQRDEAIKIGGTGATCVTYDGNQQFEFSDGVSINLPIEQKQLKKGDILIIGAGDSKGDAILATFAAAISILNI